MFSSKHIVRMFIHTLNFIFGLAKSYVYFEATSDVFNVIA